MDTLILRKYGTQDVAIENDDQSLKHSLKSNPPPSRNKKEFFEFYINNIPLSDLLDKFYNTKGSILDNWIGVLGSFENRKAQVIKVKQLLGKPISDKDIRQVYPSEWSDDEFQWYLEKTRQELSDPEIIIYCCVECGDYDCGGIKAKIDKTDNAFVWTFTEGNKQLMFSFDKYQYFDLFDKYLRQLEKKD